MVQEDGVPCKGLSSHFLRSPEQFTFLRYKVNQHATNVIRVLMMENFPLF